MSDDQSHFFISQPSRERGLKEQMQKAVSLAPNPRGRGRCADSASDSRAVGKAGRGGDGGADLATAGNSLPGGIRFRLLDVNLPDGSARNLLKEQVFPRTRGDHHDGAGWRHGASKPSARRAGLSRKPFEQAELPLCLRARRRTGNRRGRGTSPQSAAEVFLLGSAWPRWKNIGKIWLRTAACRKGLPPVLIQGETGTAKRPFRGGFISAARAQSKRLSNLSLRKHWRNPNCSDERGALRCRSARMGLFEAANGGTLFLDEIAEPAAGVASKVLTRSKDGKIRTRRQPKTNSWHRDHAATNQILQRLVAEENFARTCTIA